MDKYSQYQTEDFLRDESFINWVLDPEAAGNQAWTEWMNSGAEKKEAAQKAIDLIRTLDFKKEPVPDDLYVRLKQRIDDTIATEQNVLPKRKIIRLAWLKAAAVVAGLIILGLVFFYRKPSYTYFSTPYAAIKTVWLPDSTEVVLNANSTIRYNKNRIDNTREVSITGEAFFKVRHIDINGKAQPFKVYAGNAEIEVLGTEFNVRNISNSTAVLLREGKVRFSIAGTDAEKIMQPNDYCFYNGSQGEITTRVADPVLFTSWMEHKYRFENATIKEICETLKAYFGYEFTIRNDKLNTQTVSGTLELQNEQVMWQVLRDLFNARIIKHDNHVFIE